MEFIGSPPVHFLARSGDEWLLLPRATLDHVIHQHGGQSPGGSRFSSSLLPEQPDPQDLENFAASVVGLLRGALEAGAFRKSGVCFECVFPGMDLGVDGAFFGLVPDSYLLKEQDGKGVLVPAVNQPARTTHKLSAILVEGAGEKIPQDVLSDPRVARALAQGQLKIIASLFPGSCLLPQGGPFPRSSDMIDSSVSLSGSGIKCSQDVARQLNHTMARLKGFPPLEAMERMADVLEQKRAQPTSSHTLPPAEPPAPLKASQDDSRGSKTPPSPLAAPMERLDVSKSKTPPLQLPTVQKDAIDDRANIPRGAPAEPARFMGCVAGADGAPTPIFWSNDASAAIAWAQRHCGQDASVRLNSIDGSLALFSRWAGPDGPVSFGAPDATPAGAILVPGVDEELDQAWVQSLTRALCDKLIVKHSPPRASSMTK